MNQQTQSEPVIPVYQPDEGDDFLPMVHVALKLRSDILAQPSHQGLNVCKEDAIACVPESLYMFIGLMIGGQSLLENGLSDSDDDDKVADSDIIDRDCGAYDDDDDDDAEGDLDSDNVVEHENKQPGKRENARVRKQEDPTETRVLSIAQDLLYIVSKHVGLGSSLHQATQSKELVDMFHNVGHTISYWDVR